MLHKGKIHYFYTQVFSAKHKKFNRRVLVVLLCWKRGISQELAIMSHTISVRREWTTFLYACSTGQAYTSIFEANLNYFSGTGIWLHSYTYVNSLGAQPSFYSLIFSIVFIWADMFFVISVNHTYSIRRFVLSQSRSQNVPIQWAYSSCIFLGKAKGFQPFSHESQCKRGPKYLWTVGLGTQRIRVEDFFLTDSSK